MAALIAAMLVAGGVGLVTKKSPTGPVATPTATSSTLPSETPTESLTPTESPSEEPSSIETPTEEPSSTGEPTDEPTVEPTQSSTPPLPVSGTNDNTAAGLLLLGGAGILGGALAGRRSRVTPQSR